MIFTPLPYQTRAADFICSNKRAALHVDMGLGKTASTLMAVKRLLENFDSRGAMVFAPLRVATIAWPEEINKWDQFATMSFTVVRGSEAERIRMLKQQKDIYLLNYDLMPWWVNWIAQEIRHTPLRHDILVLDESSRLKSPSSSRFKHLKAVTDSKLFPRVVELTGTPSPESYEDLWSQFRLLDGGKRLEKYVTHFRVKYFFQNPWNKYDWKMREGADKVIQQAISDITLTLRGEDYLSLPPIIERTVSVELPKDAMRVYKEFEQQMVAQIEDKTVAAVNAAIVSEKCRQVVSGGVYDEKKAVTRLHTIKFDALDEIMESGDHYLVAYWYEHELETIKSRYPKASIIGPETKDALGVVRKWNDRKVKVLFIHPASCAHGLNLQCGGYNVVWLTIPWSNEIYQQTIKRLHRMGQTKPVIIHQIIARDTIDELVDKAVKQKEFTQQSLRKELYAIQERKRKEMPGVSNEESPQVSREGDEIQ